MSIDGFQDARKFHSQFDSIGIQQTYAQLIKNLTEGNSTDIDAFGDIDVGRDKFLSNADKTASISETITMIFILYFTLLPSIGEKCK